MGMIGALESTMVRVSPRQRSMLRANYLICHINVGAFVSVMFALLFLFMGTGAIYVDLPGGVVDLANQRKPQLPPD